MVEQEGNTQSSLIRYSIYGSINSFFSLDFHPVATWQRQQETVSASNRKGIIGYSRAMIREMKKSSDPLQESVKCDLRPDLGQGILRSMFPRDPGSITTA
jgi:hypothetical protein